MTYTIEVTSSAKQDITEAYSWLDERAPQFAAKWLDGLQAAIEGLSELPLRCPLARESRLFEEEVHQLLYGKRPTVYRVLFLIRRSKVYVLHVRHAARDDLTREDFVLPPDE